MSSYIRQTSNTEPMHDFLKDKQAWEHAIALYQGPDPLDHWYNYVCWYENYGHGDPENKFRETLEHCLSVFEHNEYYKQDVRILRLWLKYIDMQSNPLHFYQALYQRGVGREIALFYVSWGNYFESMQGLKEAESIYNLGFQEKAQPYAELQHALVKLMYARAALQQQEQQQQLQEEQQKVAQEQQVSYQSSNIHGHVQQSQQQQAYQRAQLLYAQQIQQVRIANDEEEQEQRQQQQQNIQAVFVQQHVQPQHHYHTPHTHTTLQIHENHQQAQQRQQHSSPHTHYQVHESFQQPEQQQEEFEVNETNNNGLNRACSEEEQEEYKEMLQRNQEEEIEHQQLQEQTQEVLVQYQQEVNIETVSTTTKELSGVKLSKRFVNYARNNHELWKPALCLDEPPDDNRKCHYAKNKIYPPGECFEYSPEELRINKYFKENQSTENMELNMVQQAHTQNSQSPVYSASSSDKEDIYGFSEREDELPEESGDDNFDDEDYTPENVGDDLDDIEEDDEDEQENDGDDNDGEEEEDDYDDNNDDGDDEIDEASHFRTKVVQNHQDEQQQNHQIQHRQYLECDEQIKTSTIHLGNNKSIKIKFKKERASNTNGANGTNYSAYKIESIYQQEIASPKTPVACNFERRNGHNFHPYMLGHTSTPKISSSFKRHKQKLKRVNHDSELSQSHCNNSNSSTAERETVNTIGLGVTENATVISAANDNAVQNANFNDNANYSFSSAVTLDNSNCSISSAVGRLNFKDNSALGLASIHNNTTHQNTLTTGRAGANVLELSTYQENSYFATQYDIEAKERRLSKAIETIERHLAKEIIDPFNSELCRAFLTKLDFPLNADDENYKIIQTPLPKIANTKVLNLAEGVNFNIDKEVGRGSYGSVYKATDVNMGTTVALKYQKPPNTWEIYICDQVLKRITSPNVLPGLMDISTAIIAPNASLIATEFSPFGSLLDINNKIRQNTTKVMHESLVMHFSAQICNIVHHLHQQKIIHADIKPDNFLLMRIPSTDLHYPSLRLIDFGCAIDMTLFPDGENTKFRKVIQTDGFTCIEMQEGRPWSYETDLFCVAGTIHVMLFGEYMQAQKRAGSWDMKQKLPRYLKKHVWSRFFGDIFHLKPTKLPNLDEMRRIFEEEAARMDSELQKQIRTLSNILYRR